MAFLIMTDASREACDDCGQPIEVGAEVQWRCPACQTVHRLHPHCVSAEAINIMGGPQAFRTLVRVYTAKYN